MSTSIKKIAVMVHVLLRLRRKRRGAIVVLGLMIGVREDMIRVHRSRFIAAEINITIIIKTLIIERIIAISRIKAIINLLTVKATITPEMSTTTMTNNEEETEITTDHIIVIEAAVKPLDR